MIRPCAMNILNAQRWRINNLGVDFDCEHFPSIHPWEITLFVMATIAFAAISSSSLSRTLLSLPFITACSQPNIQKKHCCQDYRIDSFSVSKSTYYEFTECFHKLLLTSEVEKATRSRIWNAVLQKRQSGSIFWIQHQSWEVEVTARTNVFLPLHSTSKKRESRF